MPRVCVEWLILEDSDGLNLLVKTVHNSGERLQNQRKLCGNTETQLLTLLVTGGKCRLAPQQAAVVPHC